MAGHSKKKDNARRSSKTRLYVITVTAITLLNIIYNLYSFYFKEESFSPGQIYGLIALTIINYGIVYLLIMFSGSFLENYFIDFLGLNLGVEILVNFHWKFWFLYLVYPAYGLYKGGIWLYGYVKTIGKEDGSNDQSNRPVSDKQKKRIIKD